MPGLPAFLNPRRTVSCAEENSIGAIEPINTQQVDQLIEALFKMLAPLLSERGLRQFKLLKSRFKDPHQVPPFMLFGDKGQSMHSVQLQEEIAKTHFNLFFVSTPKGVVELTRCFQNKVELFSEYHG